MENFREKILFFLLKNRYSEKFRECFSKKQVFLQVFGPVAFQIIIHLKSEIQKELKKGVGKVPPSQNDSLHAVGEDSALEEILPQIDDLTSRSTEFQKKITELEIQMKRPIKVEL